jgi:uncharacterized RDD family membrane protein YckC
MQHELVVLSPEKTILTYRLAGLGSRMLAHLLDLLIVFVIMMIGISLIAQLVGSVDSYLGGAVAMVLASLAPLLYFILFEGLWNGQTLGKKAAGIRVRMADGTPVTFAAALGRNLIRPADMLPGTYFVGIIAMLTNAKSQRFGDMVAGTVVVHERRPVATFAPAPHTAGIHPFEWVVGDLRGMTIDEYNALRRMCDRFPELPRTIQDKMLAELWRPIAARRNVPPVPNVHPLYLAEATVMKYGREHGLL